MFLEMPNKIYIQIVEDSSCNIETNKGSNQIRPLEVKEYEEHKTVADLPLRRFHRLSSRREQEERMSGRNAQWIEMI